MTYNIADLVENDVSNGQLKCLDKLQRLNSVCCVVLFVAAVAVSFLLALKPSDTVKTVNSFYSPVPIKEKIIQIEDLALNYLVYLRYSRSQNQNQIYLNKQALSGNRLLQNQFDRLGGAEFGGVVASGLTESEFVEELCSGLGIAILEEQSIGNYLFVPECRVLEQESENEDENDRVVVFSTFSSYTAYKVDDFDINTLSLKDLKQLNSTAKKDLKLKNDQYTAQSVLILHNG